MFKFLLFLHCYYLFQIPLSLFSFLFTILSSCFSGRWCKMTHKGRIDIKLQRKNRSNVLLFIWFCFSYYLFMHVFSMASLWDCLTFIHVNLRSVIQVELSQYQKYLVLPVNLSAYKLVFWDPSWIISASDLDGRGGTVRYACDWWSEVAGSIPVRSGNILS